jgi:hypothetical protein
MGWNGCGGAGTLKSRKRRGSRLLSATWLTSTAGLNGAPSKLDKSHLSRKILLELRQMIRRALLGAEVCLEQGELQ